MGHGSSRSSPSGNMLSSEEQNLVENLFKSLSRSSGSIKREDVFKHWSAHLDECLLQYVLKFLCHEPGKKLSVVNGDNFGKLYVYAVRGSSEERATLIFKGFSDNEQKSEIPKSNFMQYVEATVNSYLRLQKNSANRNYNSWTSIGCTISPRRINLHSQSLCEDVGNTENIINSEKLESWFTRAANFKAIQSHVFQKLFLISQKKSDKNISMKIVDLNLMPVCRGLENIPHFPSILGLSDVLFLNLSLPHALRNEWRFLFSSQIHGESFSTMLGRISMQGATLLIIQDTDNYVFGGFASCSWALSPNFSGSESCYLFKLEPKITIFNSTGYNNHYQYLNLNQQTMVNGLLMGGQFNYPGLWLDCEYGTGKSSLTCTTFQNYTQLSGSENFRIKHCEVWGVGPLPETDENERGSSILDHDPAAKVILELAGRTLHSEGLREKKNDKK